METKVCSKCRQEKVESDFGYRKPYKGRAARRDSACRACHAAETADYRWRNPEKVVTSKKAERLRHIDRYKAHDAEYYRANAEARKKWQQEYRKLNATKVKACKRAHYLNHQEEVRAKSAQWRKDNPERFKETNKRARQSPRGRAHIAQDRFLRKLKTRAAKDEAVTLAIEAIRSKIVSCHICGATLSGRECHIDHIIPLSRGGAHSVENIAPACPTCNVRKGRKTVAEYHAETVNGKWDSNTVRV